MYHIFLFDCVPRCYKRKAPPQTTSPIFECDYLSPRLTLSATWMLWTVDVWPSPVQGPTQHSIDEQKGAGGSAQTAYVAHTTWFLSQYITSHPGKLSLAIPLCVGAMSTNQRAVMLSGWGVKAAMVCVWVAGKTVWSPS